MNAVEICALRIDLAAAFRLAAEFGWHESVGNHFSAAVSDDGKDFLMNPKWRHFGSIRASDLQMLRADDTDVMARPDAPDASAWAVHAAIHRARPEARVILHCHVPIRRRDAHVGVSNRIPHFGQAGPSTSRSPTKSKNR